MVLCRGKKEAARDYVLSRSKPAHSGRYWKYSQVPAAVKGRFPAPAPRLDMAITTALLFRIHRQVRETLMPPAVPVHRGTASWPAGRPFGRRSKIGRGERKSPKASNSPARQESPWPPGKGFPYPADRPIVPTEPGRCRPSGRSSEFTFLARCIGGVDYYRRRPRSRSHVAGEWRHCGI